MAGSEPLIQEVDPHITKLAIGVIEDVTETVEVGESQPRKLCENT